MTFPDNPDFMSAVATAQQQLAHVPAGTAVVTVAIPANCETILVVVPHVAALNGDVAFGTTTDMPYPLTQILIQLSGTNAVLDFISVSPSTDGHVQITLAGAPPVDWYVVADMGIRQVADMVAASTSGIPGTTNPFRAFLVGGTDGTDLRALRVDTQGILFEVPSAPGETALDHPPNELLRATFNGSLSSTPQDLITAPGAGKRLRLFYLKVSQYSNATDGVGVEATGGVPFVITGYGGLPQLDTMEIPLSGFALPTNTALQMGAITGTADTIINAFYTIETV